MKRAVLAATLLLVLRCTHATIPLNQYGLAVVPDLATYERTAAADPDKRLVDIGWIPDLRLDVRYATTNNFMKTQLYPVERVFLRAPAARALAAIQEELAASGLGLKVFDGYRPYRVTVKMWEPIRNPDYVADPARGSRHNRGAAVDLTLVDLRTGDALPMPTAYDDFTKRAAHEFMDLPPDLVANRARLRDVMERHGFVALPSEWWHFDFRGWEKFELMDVPLEDLAAATP